MLAYKRAFSDLSSLLYGRVGEFFDTSTAYIHPRPTLADSKALAATEQEAKILYEEEVKIYAREVRQQRSDSEKLYAAMFCKLSDTSRERISQTKGWATTQKDRDPVELWKMMVATHSGSGIGTHEQEKVMIKSKFNKLYQGSDQSITDFKAVFEHCLQSLITVMQVDQSSYKMLDKDQAMKFIHKLDNARYSGFRRNLHNMVAMGSAQYPSTLLEAFTIASQYKVEASKPKAQSTNATMYMGKGEDHHKSGSKRDKQSEKKGKDKNDDSVGGKNKEGKGDKPKRFCKICDNEDHYTSACTRLDAAIALAKIMGTTLVTKE